MINVWKKSDFKGKRVVDLFFERTDPPLHKTLLAGGNAASFLQNFREAGNGFGVLSAVPAAAAASAARIVGDFDHKLPITNLLGDKKMLLAELFIHELLQCFGVSIGIRLRFKRFFLFIFASFEAAALFFDVYCEHVFSFFSHRRMRGL